MNDPDEPGFMNTLGGIKKLHQDKIDPRADRPRGDARRRPAPVEQGPDRSEAWREIPETARESYFNHGIQKKLERRIRQGQVEIDATLDLHGHRRQQALVELNSFLKLCQQQKLRQILIIHGKGYNSEEEAILRPLVQHWLEEQSSVLAWCPAQPRDGGHGATYVYLRRGYG